jgi:hypothetical protein
MAWTDLFTAFTNGSTDPGGGRDAGKLYAYDAKLISQAINTIVGGAAAAYVATQETYSTTTYGDLTTTTDSVTVTIGSSGKALVLLYADMVSNADGRCGWMGVALSGANTVAADDAMAIMVVTRAASATLSASYGAPFLMTGLTPGSTTFKAKYRANVGSTQFRYRRIAVIPFP